jgi:hypothetical protein
MLAVPFISCIPSALIPAAGAVCSLKGAGQPGRLRGPESGRCYNVSAEILQAQFQPGLKINFRFPAEEPAGLRYVRLALNRIVLRKGAVNDPAL